MTSSFIIIKNISKNNVNRLIFLGSYRHLNLLLEIIWIIVYYKFNNRKIHFQRELEYQNQIKINFRMYIKMRNEKNEKLKDEEYQIFKLLLIFLIYVNSNTIIILSLVNFQKFSIICLYVHFCWNP